MGKLESSPIRGRELWRSMSCSGSCEQLQVTDTEAGGKETVGQEDQAKERHTSPLVMRRRMHRGTAEEGLMKMEEVTVNTQRELPSKNLSKELRRQSVTTSRSGARRGLGSG